MGIPKFNRFLTNRYPMIQEDIKDGTVIEIDNFFVDMNMIIHLCTHPEGVSEENYIAENVYENIFSFLDVIFEIVKPRKLLFLAIDGVAPRAKLNQQRTRRFTSAKEREIWNTLASEIEGPPFSRFDTNCITPGTKFMERLQKYLEYYISYRVSTSPSWKKIKVILCGSQVAGEGEHKIMAHLRTMKKESDYTPNDRHCLYGLDADLIVLGLCTHERNISILREKPSPSGKTIRLVHPRRENFSLIHLSLLKEYLEMEFYQLKYRLPFEYKLRGIIDDWVLLGLLVGNDFIPSLADFRIERGAIQMLYRTYIEVLPTLTGYLTVDGNINLGRFQVFMKKLAKNIEKNFRAKNHPYFDGRRDLAARNNLNFDVLFAEYERNYYSTKLRFTRTNFGRKCKTLAREYVRGLQWMLHYYYRGCPSWSWFYPQHYGPCASSFVDIEGTCLDFTLGKPFLPYEQLLAVLPPSSKTLLPKCYRKLMTAKDSPIRKYYPREFETDLNGGRNEWEAVVLLPMIVEEELVSAMKPLVNRLKPKEKQNNTHRDMLVYTYAGEVQDSVSAPRYFPVFNENHASVRSARLGESPPGVRIILSSTMYRVQQDTYFLGFPTFKNINHRGQKVSWEITLPNSTARIDRFQVNIREENVRWSNLRATNLLGKSVYVNWPNLSEARIVSVWDASRKYSENGGIQKIHELGENEKSEWTGVCSSLCDKYRERGIEIGDTTAVVFVNYLKGIRRYFDSSKGRFSRKQIWSEVADPVPLQIVVEYLSIYEYGSTEPVTVAEMFPLGTEVFSLEYSTYGCKGEITSAENNPDSGRLPVKLEIVNDSRLNKEVGRYREPHYYSQYGVGIKLGIRPAIVGKIAGSIRIIFERENLELNIGLQIANSESEEKVPGYTKKEGDWTYSYKAVTLMYEYIKKFPKVVDFLSANRATGKTSFTESDLIDGFNDPEYFKRIARWVRGLECSRIERVKCDSQIVDEDFIERLQQSFACIPCDVKSQELVFMKLEDLFTNNLVTGDVAPVAATHYKLFDRIVCIKQSGNIPFGARGYIVGIISTGNGSKIYNILLDKSSVDILNVSSQIVRKVRMSRADFINITRGKADVALSKGALLNTHCILAYSEIIRIKASGIWSMLAKKIRIYDLILLLFVGLKSKKESSPTVLNTRLDTVQKRFWMAYYSGFYNPFLIPSPSRQLLQQGVDSRKHHRYLYFLSTVQRNRASVVLK